ncbi:hypothetical protein MVEG_00269 [Podila verticillata NRRL 6337]|nr:hypothetical protein MVEG_00269 [Podila verticillata NRRL 6337]
MATPHYTSRRPIILASTFTCACFNMLASGSLYVYALYAPSFKSHLGYSQTQTSAIAVIGDLGLYGVGPLTGGLADSMGPKRASAFAGSLLLMGYGLLSYCYRTGIESIKHNEPAPNFLAMSAFLFLAGIGSSACYMAAFTTLAKSFKQGRGIAIGIPVSFFGLSAAALAFVAQKFFLLDTGRFLLFLAVAGGVINGMSIVGLNVVPEPEIKDIEEPLPVPPSLQETHHTVIPTEESPLLQATPTTTAATETTTTRLRREVPNISGRAFFLDRDAQYFFMIMLCLTGSGLMIINSISAIVEAVAAGEDYGSAPGHNETPLATIQATHVGLISISSYVGRLVAGFGSDVAMVSYGAQRIYVVPIATACMALAQVVGMFASLRWLYLCSMLTGFAYGGFFGVAGTIVAELWGEVSCGQNWGFLSWGSAVGGMLFNVLFGMVVDRARTAEDSENAVCKGHRCFRWALVVSFAACILSFAISLVMSARHRRRALSH